MAKRGFFRTTGWLIVMFWGFTCGASVHSSQHRTLTPALWQSHRPRVGMLLPDLSALPTVSGSCEVSQPPEALATPDPLLAATGSVERVAVSFIIGADGQVHSPVILESAGSLEDSNVLDALRAWRYRPALCNATPAESESRIEFSSR
ncbi:MAG: TonB family protein [Terriglobales bacterium]